jgi:hypothetical protein
MFVDFVFYYGAYVRNFEIGVKSVIRHVPRCVSDGSKYFRLTSLHNYHVGLASTSPELDAVCPAINVKITVLYCMKPNYTASHHRGPLSQ